MKLPVNRVKEMSEGTRTMTTITNPTGRNTQAYIVKLDDGTQLFFSYKTLIAIDDPNRGYQARIRNSWGPTTGRHFRELGCGKFPVVEELPPVLSAIQL